MTNMSSPHLT